jgi:hypothetical protein
MQLQTTSNNFKQLQTTSNNLKQLLSIETRAKVFFAAEARKNFTIKKKASCRCGRGFVFFVKVV